MFSNFERNYFERILGYELFTTELENIESKIGIKLTHRVELAVFYDMLAKVYINALANRNYPINITPLFYLQLKAVRARIDNLNDRHISTFPENSSAKYLSRRFAKEIAAIELRFSLLANYIIRYKNYRFKDTDSHKLVAFLDSMRFKRKPDWLRLFESTEPKEILVDPLKIRLARSDVGQDVLVLRPYVIKTDGEWSIEKVPVLFGKNNNIRGRFYFDIFLVSVLDKSISMDNVETLTGEAEFGKYQFNATVQPCRLVRKAVPVWKMSYVDKITKEIVEENIPFYELCDFHRVNKTLGYPLNEYQLNRLIQDAEFQIATLG